MSDNYYASSVQRGGRFQVFQQSLKEADFEWRLQEAQRAYDMAKPGDCIPVDLDLMPHIIRTDKSVSTYSDEITEFGDSQ